jgi:rhamnosyltransferase
MVKIALIIPTLNIGEKLKELLESINKQTIQPSIKLIIDSSPTNTIDELARAYGFIVIKINQKDFNHGATRQLGVEKIPEADIFLFLTQDVILVNERALENLLLCFDNPKVGAAYGRQLPRPNAKLIEAHARLFNYRDTSSVKSFQDSSIYGVKTAFISNSFAAYRRSALVEVGGFPKNVILCEDTYVAAKMLMNDWLIAYSAEAKVYHSHNYSYRQEFQRYFDIGVFHGRESWLQQKFGRAEGEGLQFVLSELKYLIKHNILLIPSAMIRTVLKLTAYRLGLMEHKLPKKVKSFLSMNKCFWQNHIR